MAVVRAGLYIESELIIDGQPVEPDAPELRRWPSRVAADRVRVAVIVPGDPLSKQRPRFAYNRGGSVYTPVETSAAEGRLKVAIQASHKALVLDADSAFGVRLSFFTKTYQRRDVDNMSKLLFDACTGVVWVDDSQVEELHARVVRKDTVPRTEILIYTKGAVQRPTRSCAACGRTYRIYPSWGDKKFCSKLCADASMMRRRDVTCARCGATFKRVASHRGAKAEYCSTACKTADARVAVTCAECSRSFDKPRHAVNTANYCSRDCQIAAATKRTLAASPRGTCVTCGAGTSRPEYIHCQACAIRLRRPVTGIAR